MQLRKCRNLKNRTFSSTFGSSTFSRAERPLWHSISDSLIHQKKHTHYTPILNSSLTHRKQNCVQRLCNALIMTEL